MAIELRRAVVADLDSIEALLDALMQSVEAGHFYRDDRAFIRRHITEEGFVLLAEEKDRLAGYIMMRYPGEAEDNLGWDLGWDGKRRQHTAHLEAVAVHADFRGRGLQRLMMAEAERHLPPDCWFLLATVAPDNLYSLRNLQALGYEIACTKEKYGGYGRHIMVKKLQQP